MNLDELFPPQSVASCPEAERAVLAIYMLEPATLDEHPTRAEHYSDARHRTIFESLAHLRAEGQEVDLVTLFSRLSAEMLMEKAGGAGYVAGLDSDLPDCGRIEAYVQILEDRLLRRRIAALSRSAIRAAGDGSRSAVEVLASIQADVARLGMDLSSGGYIEIGEVLSGIEARLRTMHRGEAFGLSTGLSRYDEVAGGFLPGQLIVIAGRPGHGKTSLGLQMAEHQARQGVRVGFVSLEMTAKELGFRLLSRGTGFESRKISHNRLHPGMLGMVFDAVARAQGLPLSIDDRATLRAEQVVLGARRFAVKESAGILYVDHLQLMTGDGRSRNEEIGRIAGDFKRLAKDLGIPVVLLSQLSRGAEKRGANSRPMLSELRDSGDIEAHADQVTFTYQPYIVDGNPETKGDAYIVIAKNRSGMLGEIDCRFDGPTTTFFEVERRA